MQQDLAEPVFYGYLIYKCIFLNRWKYWKNSNLDYICDYKYNHLLSYGKSKEEGKNQESLYRFRHSKIWLHSTTILHSKTPTP